MDVFFIHGKLSSGFDEDDDHVQAFLGQAHYAQSDSSSAATGQESQTHTFSVSAYATEALDSGSPDFWSLCFPTLFYLRRQCGWHMSL